MSLIDNYQEISNIVIDEKRMDLLKVFYSNIGNAKKDSDKLALVDDLVFQKKALDNAESIINGICEEVERRQT